MNQNDGGLEDGGPAFPIQATFRPSDGAMWNETCYGLTKREWFAGMALQGICSVSENGSNMWQENECKNASAVAYALADAMIEAGKTNTAQGGGECA